MTCFVYMIASINITYIFFGVLRAFTVHVTPCLFYRLEHYLQSYCSKLQTTCQTKIGCCYNCVATVIDTVIYYCGQLFTLMF